MQFPRRDDGPRIKVPDPHGYWEVKIVDGRVRTTWIPEHPHHPASRIYTGRRRALQCK